MKPGYIENLFKEQESKSIANATINILRDLREISSPQQRDEIDKFISFLSSYKSPDIGDLIYEKLKL